MSPHRVDLLARLLLQPGEDPLLEPLHVDVEPVGAPVEVLGVPGDAVAVFRREPLVQFANGRAAEDVLVVPQKRHEELEEHPAALELGLPLVELVREAPRERLHPRGAPARRSFREKTASRVGQPLGGGRAEALEVVSVDPVGLEAGAQQVEQLAPLFAPPVEAPLVEANEFEASADVEWVYVARPEVVDAARARTRGRRGGEPTGAAPVHEVRSRGDDPRGDEVHGDDVHDGLAPTGIGAMPLQRQERKRRAGGESLVPAREREAERALDDGRPDDGPADVAARDDLLAERLRIGVGVGPAPVAGALHPDLDEPLGDPELPLPTRGESQRLRVCRVAPLLAQALRRPLAELGNEGPILSRFALLRDAPLAVGNLLLGIEAGRVERAALGTGDDVFSPREVAADGLVLEDHPVAVAGDEARGHVQQRRSEAPTEAHGVARASRVHLDGKLEGRGEVHEPGTVDDQVESLHSRQVALGESEEGVGDVSRDRGTFLPHEGLEPRAVCRAQRVEGSARHHLVPETQLGVPAVAGAHQHEHAAHLRIAVQQQREGDFAEEAGRAGDEQPPAGECLAHVERRLRRGNRAQRRVAPGPRGPAERLLAHPRFWVITMGGR